jgi:cation diffusion facilitator family transporter
MSSPKSAPNSQRRLQRWMILAIVAALVTIALKSLAWQLTGSVGLLSDALESGVNLFAAVTAYLSLRYSARPIDANHTYGHEKIEYFSSGLEGVLVGIAGLGTAWVAVDRMIHPRPLEALGLGTGLALGASLINLVVGLILVREGKYYRSIILEADGRHLLTDVWTSAGVIAGLAVVWLTGIGFLDPLIALLVGLNILRTAGGLIGRSFNGLMDHALPDGEIEILRGAIKSHLPPDSSFHALRTRQAGARRFVDFHLLVPGKTTVTEGHRLADLLEDALHRTIPGLEITIHIEPIEDSASYEDNRLKDIEPPS